MPVETRLEAVTIPLVLILPSVPIPEASAPIHFSVISSYVRTLPSTLAVSLSTSSKNSILVSPEPGP